MKVNRIHIILIFSLSLPILRIGFAQVSYLGLDGGLEGTATIDNTTINTLPQANTWTKANATQTIANETTTIRSGNNSLKINNTSTTGRRVWSPLISIVSTTSALTIQYYRYVADTANGQNNQEGIYRNPAAEGLQGTYDTPTPPGTWEKQAYSPASVTFTSIAGVIMHKIKGAGGNMFIDDMCVYTGAVDVTAANSPGALTVSTPTTSSLDLSWGAATGGVDGGGYIVVRGIVDPTTVPNINGIYAVGNLIAAGMTVAYSGTGTSFTDAGLASATTYFYRVYTFDKAYNYSSAVTSNGTTTGGCVSPSISSQPSNTAASVGGSAVFSLTASGTGLTYQWQENQSGSWANVTDGGIYSGATTAILTLTGVTLAMNTWQYQCIVSGACAPSVTSTAVTLTVVTTAVGDYRTRANGNWGINTTWEKWNGSAWVACIAGDFPDVSTASATIMHTVDFDGTAGAPFNCKDVTIDLGARLWCNNFTASNSYLIVYGNITCNGTIGTTAGDDICFSIPGGSNCTISGTSSFTATRIRKHATLNSGTDASLTVAMNINLTWSSVSGTVIYNDGSASNFNVTVTVGKTLRASGPGAVAANIAIDGNNFSAPDVGNSGGSYTVFGTMDMDGIMYAYTDNTVAGRSCSYTIKTGGIIKCRYVYAAASGVSGSNLTIENGGKLTIFGSIDTVTATLNDTTWKRFSTVNNTYNLQSGSTVEYSGFTQQHTESGLTYSNITFSGGGKKYLNGPTTVNDIATFTNGIVYSTSANILLMSSTSSATGASNISYVSGPIRKTGNTAFEFPTGKGGYWAPITISAPGVVTDHFTAEYFNTAPYSPVSVTTPLQYASYIEHWVLDRTNGSSDVFLTLFWKDGTRSGINDITPSDLRVAHWNGTTWNDKGQGTITGTTALGSIQSAAAVSTFSPFTFASTSVSLSTNPLPIELLNFNANYYGATVCLNWTTASETNNDYFTIERSSDAIFFNEINITDGAENSTSILNYSTIDDSPLSGTSYYRLKQTDFNGDFKYSNIVSVQKIENDFEIVSSNYTQSENQFAVYFNCNTNCLITLELYDLTGKKVYSSIENTLGKNSEITISTKKFIKGIYLLKAFNGKKIISKKIQL